MDFVLLFLPRFRRIDAETVAMMATAVTVIIMYSVGEVGVDPGSGDCVGFTEAEDEGEADGLGDSEDDEVEVGDVLGDGEGVGVGEGLNEGVGESEVTAHSGNTTAALEMSKGVMSGW